MPPDPEDDALAREVYVGDAYTEFGEVTADDARALAGQLAASAAAGSWLWS
jgi:hypothetical protein